MSAVLVASAVELDGVDSPQPDGRGGERPEKHRDDVELQNLKHWNTFPVSALLEPSSADRRIRSGPGEKEGGRLRVPLFRLGCRGGDGDEAPRHVPPEVGVGKGLATMPARLDGVGIFRY